MKIVLVAKRGYKHTGVGRYTEQLSAALSDLGHEILIVHPAVPLPRFLMRIVHRLLGWDLDAFFNNFPLWARYPPADVYHLTSQNLATLMLVKRPPGPTVITVHDIIPWLVRHDPALRDYNHRLAEWFDRLALAGLRRGHTLIADSKFTQVSLTQPDVAVGNSVVVALGVE